MRCYDVQAPASRVVYEALLNVAGEYSSTFLLVVREAGDEQAVAPTFAALRPFLLGREEAREWPGTELIGKEVATVYRYRAEPAALDALRSLAPSFLAWVGPERPEDLCFLRANGAPWLTTIAHEGIVFLTLADDERHRIAELVDLTEVVVD